LSGGQSCSRQALALQSLTRFSAIFALDDLPEKWKHFTEINASYVQASKFTPQSSPNTKQ